MVQQHPAATAPLHEVDETAWLEATADLIRNNRLQEVDLDALTAGWLGRRKSVQSR